jgi:hypothetical protein
MYESARPNNGDFKLQIRDSPEVSADDGSLKGQKIAMRANNIPGEHLSVPEIGSAKKPWSCGGPGLYRPCISATAHQKW